MPRGRLATLAFFLGPALLLILVFFLVPTVLTAALSFTDLYNWQFHRMKYVGLENYRSIIDLARHDPDMKIVLKTTLVFTAVTLVVNVVGGLALAIATFLIEERVSMAFRLLWILPRMTPLAVFGLLWYYFFYPSEFGTLNSVLLKLGVIDEPINLGHDYLPWGPWSIIIFANGIVGVSFGMVIFYSAFRSIPRELIVAARVDGATTWQVVRHILVPMVRWHVIFVTVWQLLSLLTTYPHLFVLTEWGVVYSKYGTTWALYVFKTAFGAQVSLQGLAAAAAVFLVIIGGVLGYITLRVMRFEELIQPPRGDL